MTLKGPFQPKLLCDSKIYTEYTECKVNELSLTTTGGPEQNLGENQQLFLDLLFFIYYINFIFIFFYNVNRNYFKCLTLHLYFKGMCQKQTNSG